MAQFNNFALCDTTGDPNPYEKIQTMNEQAPETVTDGVQLQAFAPELSIDDLQQLNAFVSRERLFNKAPLLCKWLGDFLEAEITRREQIESGGDAFDADAVTINCTNWTGGDLADAIVAVFVMRETSERPAVREFLKHVDLAIRSWAAHRLRCMD